MGTRRVYGATWCTFPQCDRQADPVTLRCNLHPERVIDPKPWWRWWPV